MDWSGPEFRFCFHNVLAPIADNSGYNGGWPLAFSTVSAGRGRDRRVIVTFRDVAVHASNPPEAKAQPYAGDCRTLHLPLLPVCHHLRAGHVQPDLPAA